MRGLLLALLLGAVLQSWGQKFPGVVNDLPKLGFELPVLTACGVFPPCLTKPGRYVTGQHNLRSFAEVLGSFESCCNMRFILLEETPHSADGLPITVEGNSFADLVCKGAKAYQVDIRATMHNGELIVVFRHTPQAKGTGL